MPAGKIAPKPPAAGIESDLRELCRYWDGHTRHMKTMEASDPADVAIYGAFFYGTLLFAIRDKKDAVRCFVDRNHFYWNGRREGKPICGPDAMPKSIKRIYFGVKPQIAATVADEFKAIIGRDIDVVLPPPAPKFTVA
jgi:hypothetical protein